MKDKISPGKKEGNEREKKKGFQVKAEYYNERKNNVVKVLLAEIKNKKKKDFKSKIQ
jgi:hypothetical protein